MLPIKEEAELVNDIGHRWSEYASDFVDRAKSASNRTRPARDLCSSGRLRMMITALFKLCF